MSIVYITNHNENIYDASEVPTGVAVEKVETYEPKPAEEIIAVRRTQHVRTVQKHGTMGPPHTEPPNPSEFLKKGTGKIPQARRKRMVLKEYHSPLTKDEVLEEQDAKLSLWRPKNAIKLNIQYAKQMIPKVPEKRVMIDRKGTSKPLKPSLEPTFLPSAMYGKLPKYLNTFLKDKERHRLKQLQMGGEKGEKGERTQPICYYLTRDKRSALLDGLKANWAEMQSQYSLLPILTDTIPKKIRKSKLEAELKQLEKDIVLIERHPYIYIYPDDEDRHGEGAKCMVGS